MSYTAHHDTFTNATGFKAFLARLGAALSRYAERQSRADQVAKLDAKSDAELAQLGLTREGIVHHVFRDKMYV